MKLKIALLDDDPAFIELAEYAAKKVSARPRHHIELVCFRNASDFLNAADESFNLFLIDTRLDGKIQDGAEVARIIKERHHRTAVLMFSAYFKKLFLGSQLCKEGLTCKKIAVAFLRMQRDPIQNALEIMIPEHKLIYA